MKRNILYRTILIFLLFNYSSPAFSRDYKTVFTQPQKIKVLNNKFPKILMGQWCFSIKNSVDFTLNMITRNDSVFCTYSYVKFNGSFLNAEGGDDDWAFAVSKEKFKDGRPIILLIKNYNGLPNTFVHVSLTYENTSGKLFWQMKENDDYSINSLPKNVRLSKCK